MTDAIEALQASADRLRSVVAGLEPAQLTDPAYPTEWTIADVLSHLGSGAVIALRRLDDILAGVPTPDDAAPAVWDEWNAKAPAAQAVDALDADRALLDRFGHLTDDERARFHFSLGPMELDLEGFVALRLNEHALHLWDIEVALDPSATVAPDSVPGVVDNLAMWAGFTGKPTDAARMVVVATTGPQRTVTLVLGPERVEVTTTADAVTPDLVLPAEALIRLVYGRLDADHTPPVEGGADLDELRAVFPGA